LQHFFNGDALVGFNNTCRQFADQVLPRLMRSKALLEIEKLKKEDFTIVIVSASPENWIAPWAAQTGVELLCSRLEIRQGKLTGKLVGKNCYGIEKVERIRRKYNLDNYSKVYAYGDTAGDKPMLALASTSFYKPFQ
jgi:HAD superfamily hydrolase (TIGR01490 family)